MKGLPDEEPDENGKKLEEFFAEDKNSHEEEPKEAVYAEDEYEDTDYCCKVEV